MSTPDFYVEDHGSLLVITPMTEEARTWVDENVDVPGWAQMGPSFGAEIQPALEIVYGAIEQGFEIR